MSWLFQGNPKVFDIDQYLSNYRFIYWGAPKFQKEIHLGDTAFIWRSGKAAGLVAYGTITELPKPRGKVARPVALGVELWTSKVEDASDPKVGITLIEVRLHPADGMVSRTEFSSHSVLSSSAIIKVKQGTIFKLTPQQQIAALSLWSGLSLVEASSQMIATEGQRKLEQHYVRERSTWIVSRKKEIFLSDNKTLYCEICGFDFSKKYPVELGRNYIEVHHMLPISAKRSERDTKLSDLLLVCSNCHSMLHRNSHISENLVKLRRHFTC